MSVRKRIKNAIQRLPSPYGNRVLSSIYALAGRGSPLWGGEPRFSGWGMEVWTNPPWDGTSDALTSSFNETHVKFKESLKSGDFLWTQLGDNPRLFHEADGFRWRQYLITVSTHLALKNTDSRHGFQMVELGVCDGWSAWYALSAALNETNQLECWLYDSFAEMRHEELLPSEFSFAGSYSHLSADQTKRNLIEFRDFTNFCVGYAPQVFEIYPGPSIIHWLHIDVNSAKPTLAALSHFWDKIPRGGIVLLDDYGWPDYEDTKIRVDDYLNARNHWVMALPTGQGIVFKHQ